MTNLPPPVPALPAPPPPGAPTQRYGYPGLGPQGHQFATIPDVGSESSGRGSITSFELPVTVTYVNETRWFNTFRAERRPQADRTSESVTPTGRTRVRRDGGRCWNEQEVEVTTFVELAYDELQRFEVWRINTTLAAYYEFFTGFGGTAVDFAIDGSAVAAAGVSEAATAAAVETAAVATAAAGDLEAGIMASASLNNAAAVTGAAARVLGAVGWGYLVFQVTTGAMVWYAGSAANLAGDMLHEGWQTLRRFHDSPVEESRRIEWRRTDEPHPCLPAEEARLANEDGFGLVAPRRPGVSPRERSRRALLIAITAGASGLVLLLLLLFSLRDDDAPVDEPSAVTVTTAPVVSSTEVVAPPGVATTVALAPGSTAAAPCVVGVTAELVSIDVVPGEYHQGNIAVHVRDAAGAGQPGTTVAVTTVKSDGTSTQANGTTNDDGTIVFGMRTTAYGANSLEVTEVQAPGCTWEQSAPAIVEWQAQP